MERSDIMSDKVEIMFLDKEQEGLFKPATNLAAGFDLRSTTDYTVLSGETVKIPTGIAVHMGEEEHGIIPCAVIMPRSGLGCKGIRPRNAPGLIDADYQGEVVVCLYNGSKEPFEVKRHDRIAQMVFMLAWHPIFTAVDEFSLKTARGVGGFGSTGQG